MQNELLNSIKNIEEFVKYLEKTPPVNVRADLENLLLLQREYAADKAETMDISKNPYAPYHIVDKESIINANILNK